jgi:hypothetical protein
VLTWAFWPDAAAAPTLKINSATVLTIEQPPCLSLRAQYKPEAVATPVSPANLPLRQFVANFSVGDNPGATGILGDAAL